MGERSIRRRAVGEEQKEERRQAIIEAAWRLFQHNSYEVLTIAEVAKALDLAKGTVFLYFRTKEALFLAVLERQLAGWFAEVDAGLDALSVPVAIAQVVDILCYGLEEGSGLVRLLSILHTLLEHNIKLGEAIHFKHFLLQHMTQTGTRLERCLPFLTAGRGAHLLLQCQALAIGFWHLADPAPVISVALERPELHAFELQFALEFSHALQALLIGLEVEASMKSQQEE